MPTPRVERVIDLEQQETGRDLWESVKNDIDYVLSHPNGWEGFQQTQMREAIVKAGLIPDTTKGHSRVSFVTEGEASLHFSIENGLPPKALKVSATALFTCHL